jgi:transcriptional repressor NrdR
MRCPVCGCVESKVLDSRPIEEGSVIRRRRECDQCGRRFTTYEKYEETPLVVVKKDGRREAFDRRKILNGILRACEKRPVSLASIEAVVSAIERDIRALADGEIDSVRIGELVMEHLRDLLSGSVTIIIASHDLNLLAKYCDKVMILSQGKIVAFGRPEEVITSEMVEQVYGVEVVILNEGGDIYAIPRRTRRKEAEE